MIPQGWVVFVKIKDLFKQIKSVASCVSDFLSNGYGKILVQISVI